MRSVETLFAVLIAAGPAWAHSQPTHKLIARNAIAQAPLELRAFLGSYEREVLLGALAPDTRFMDALNHRCHAGETRNPLLVRDLADDLVAMTRNGAPGDRVAFFYGVVSHYVADISQPLHTDRAASEWLAHPIFEWMGASILGWSYLDRPYAFSFDGRLDPIADFADWQTRNADWGRARYRDVLTAAVRRQRHELSRLWVESVDKGTNDVIDLWAEIHARAGVPVERAMKVVVDKKGRLYVSGKRAREVEAPAVYLEIDDRFRGDPLERVKAERISSVRLNMRSRFSNAVRWVATQVAG